MKYLELVLDEHPVQLRLETAKLQQYLKDTDTDKQNPLIGVLDALTNLDKKIALLTRALQWEGNQNTVKSGAKLLDMMHDDGMKPQEVNRTILKLIALGGLIDEEDLNDLAAANDLGDVRFNRIMCSLLAAEDPDLPQPPAGENPAEAENPTTAQPTL